jgi:hypothetical protein
VARFVSNPTESKKTCIFKHIWSQVHVLVYDDALVETWSGHKAKFVRQFANLKGVRDTGVHNYAEAVGARMFLDPKTESYVADEAEWARLGFMESEKDELEGDDIQ